jgi:hypothetical protein
MLRQFDGRGGSGRIRCGMRLWSGALSPMTIFSTGTL